MNWGRGRGCGGAWVRGSCLRRNDGEGRRCDGEGRRCDGEGVGVTERAQGRRRGRRDDGEGAGTTERAAGTTEV